jgi:hypothetical protein
LDGKLVSGHGSGLRLYLAGEPNATRIIAQVFTGTTVQPVILGGSTVTRAGLRQSAEPVN